MKKTVFILLAFLCSVSFISAQDGSLDMTFNPEDKGFGDSKTLNGIVHSIAVNPDGKIIAGGGFFVHNSVLCKSIARFLPDGKLDPDFLAGSGFDDEVKVIVIQPDGKIIVGGQFTHFNGFPANRLVRLNDNGTLDETFVIGNGFDDNVETIAIQADGNILVGGAFLSYQSEQVGRMVRLYQNGEIDTTFLIENGFDGSVSKITIQHDNKIIAGGNFKFFRSIPREALIRILPNGDLDETFNPLISYFGQSPANVSEIALQSNKNILIIGNFHLGDNNQKKYIASLDSKGKLNQEFNFDINVNGSIRSACVQANGKILIGGSFTRINEKYRPGIARLNVDGSLDETFQTYGILIHLQFHVGEIVQLPNQEKIVIGGLFDSKTDKNRWHFAILNPTGSIDATFNPQSGFGKTGFDGSVDITAIQQDGKILAGGVFSNYFGFPTSNLVRLEKDGSIDETFNIGTGFNGYVSILELQKDGKIMVGGNFTNFNGTDINRVLRLHPDGRFDESFDPGTGFENPVTGICIQEDGKILIGGEFTFYNGQFQKRLLRVFPDGTLDESFDALFLDIRKIRAVTIHENKIYVAGSLGEPGIELSHQINRINLDGKPDEEFNCGEEFLYISSLSVKSDGKILVAGRQNFWEEESLGLIQLNPNGLKDANFANNNPKPPFNMYIIDKIIVDKNGKILLVSNLTEEVSSNFTRLNSDGSLDTTFNIGTGFDNYITTLAIQDDGNIIIGGGFTSFNGVGRNKIARLIGSTGVLIPNPIPDQPILCYPNPTTGKVNIHLDKHYPDLSLTLVDIFGRTILQKHFVDTQNIELEINSQPGLYFVTLKSADGLIKTIPVVKQ